jgi:transcriptional regulator with XRE-family HTH domain
MARGHISALDVEIGRKIRLRRLEQSMSQTALAEKLNVTFQQVQKYEKGTNRVGAGRLHLIASELKVPVTYFFQAEQQHGEVDSLLYLNSPASIRMVKAFAKIKSQKVKKGLLELAEALAAG